MNLSRSEQGILSRPLTTALTFPNGSLKRRDFIGREKLVSVRHPAFLSPINVFIDLAPLTTVGNLVCHDWDPYAMTFAEGVIISHFVSSVYPSGLILPVARVRDMV